MEHIEIISAVNTLLLAPIYFIINSLKNAIISLRNQTQLHSIQIAKLEERSKNG